MATPVASATFRAASTRWCIAPSTSSSPLVTKRWTSMMAESDRLSDLALLHGKSVRQKLLEGFAIEAGKSTHTTLCGDTGGRRWSGERQNHSSPTRRLHIVIYKYSATPATGRTSRPFGTVCASTSFGLFGRDGCRRIIHSRSGPPVKLSELLPKRISSRRRQIFSHAACLPVVLVQPAPHPVTVLFPAHAPQHETTISAETAPWAVAVKKFCAPKCGARAECNFCQRSQQVVCNQ